MKNLVETSSGEIVEIINGTLVCKNTKKNWETIGEWMMSHESGFKLEIKIAGKIGNQLNIEIPVDVPVFNLESLLEAFNYQ